MRAGRHRRRVLSAVLEASVFGDGDAPIKLCACRDDLHELRIDAACVSANEHTSADRQLRARGRAAPSASTSPGHCPGL